MGPLPEEADRGEPSSLAPPEGNAACWAPRSLAPPAGHERKLLLERVGGARRAGRSPPGPDCSLIGGCRRVRSWETASVTVSVPPPPRRRFSSALTLPVFQRLGWSRRRVPRRRAWTTSTPTTGAGASQVRRLPAAAAGGCSSAAESSSRLSRTSGAADVHAGEVQEGAAAAAGGQPALPPRPEAVRSGPAPPDLCDLCTRSQTRALCCSSCQRHRGGVPARRREAPELRWWRRRR